MQNNKPRIFGKITKFTKKEIANLFKKSKFLCRNSGLAIKFVSTDNDIGKILIITPKKIGSAPIRNQIRRRIKSIFYEEKMYGYGYDFILYCNKDIVNFNFNSLKSIFIDCLSQLKSQTN